MNRKTNFRRRLAVFALFAVAAVALALRFYGMDERPMHSDEAVQAYRVGELLAGKTFVYNPQDFHGPTLYYFAFWLARLCGIADFAALSESLLRGVPAFIGALACLGIPLCFFGWRRPTAVLITGTLLAFSPISTFYNGYFIQETLLVAFAWMAAGVALTRPKTLGNALLAGTFAGLAVASKETWLLMLLAFVCSATGIQRLRFFFNASEEKPRRDFRKTLAYLAVLLGSTGTVAALFYSSFGENPRGIIDFFVAFKHYFFAGFSANSPEDANSVAYYFNLLWDEERGGVLVAITVAVSLLCRALLLPLLPQKKSSENAFSQDDFRLPIFFFGSTFGLLFFYTILPYKTPWLVLGIVPGIYLFVGSAIDSRVLKKTWLRSRLHAISLIGIFALCWLISFLSPQLSLRYVHTSDALPEITAVVANAKRDFVAAGGKSENFFVALASKEYWPLPWYLRRERFGCWDAPQNVPEIAPLIIAEPESWSGTPWDTKKFRTVFCAELRPGIILEARTFFETRD